MRGRLAGRLLDAVLDWSDSEREARMPLLLAMAELKWDGYAGFPAGQGFLESLARWLAQFDPSARLRWLDFVLDQMVFISNAEIEHAITTVYPDIIRPQLVRAVSAQIGVPSIDVARVTSDATFKATQRRLLILGLSDGARLDLLRRASPGLSHEQFSLSPELSSSQRKRMREKLAAALQQYNDDGDVVFTRLVLVDDFYGSGTSLIDVVRDEQDHVLTRDGRPELSGKLARLLEHARSLREPDGDEPALLDPHYTAGIVLYVCSQAAREHIRSTLDLAGLAWTVDVVQMLPPDLPVSDPTLLSDCDWFYDTKVLADLHKGDSARGYRNMALPVVLSHNAPNNSISPLWADSRGRESLERHALFPRYERHHAERP